MRIAAVILTYGTDNGHLQLLTRLAECALVADVIVVHNPRDTGESSPRALGAAELYRQERNLGYAGGMNVGLERALATRADAVLLLTQDALITCGAINELVDALTEYRAGIVGPTLYTPDGSRLWSAGKSTSWTYATQHLTSFEADAIVVPRMSIDGSVMLISRDVAERVRFNEGYFMYYEDSAYCRQAWAHGRSVVVATRAHASSVPGGPSRPSAHAYLTARNRLYYAREHGRIASIRAFFGSLYAIARAIPKPGGTRFGDRALRQASVRSAWAMVRGVVDYW